MGVLLTALIVLFLLEVKIVYLSKYDIMVDVYINKVVKSCL